MILNVKSIREIEAPVIMLLRKPDRSGSKFVFTFIVLSDEASDVRIDGTTDSRTLEHRGNEMTLGGELASKTAKMLGHSGTSGAGMQAMRNAVPRQFNLVTRALILQMKQKLLRHARTCGRVSLDAGHFRAAKKGRTHDPRRSGCVRELGHSRDAAALLGDGWCNCTREKPSWRIGNQES